MRLGVIFWKNVLIHDLISHDWQPSTKLAQRVSWLKPAFHLFPHLTVIYGKACILIHSGGSVLPGPTTFSWQGSCCSRSKMRAQSRHTRLLVVVCVAWIMHFWGVVRAARSRGRTPYPSRHLSHATDVHAHAYIYSAQRWCRAHSARGGRSAEHRVVQ